MLAPTVLLALQATALLPSPAGRRPTARAPAPRMGGFEQQQFGKAGTAGAPGVVMNAINDALSPFDVRVSHQPITPERILKALGKF